MLRAGRVTRKRSSNGRRGIPGTLMGEDNRYCLILLCSAGCSIPLGVRLWRPKLVYTTAIDEGSYHLVRTCCLCSMLRYGVLHVLSFLQEILREHRLRYDLQYVHSASLDESCRVAILAN